MEAFTPPAKATPDTAIVWREGRFYLLDQRGLPQRAEYLALQTAQATADAIRDLSLIHI